MYLGGNGFAWKGGAFRDARVRLYVVVKLLFFYFLYAVEGDRRA